jgi:hypothetical protein
MAGTVTVPKNRMMRSSSWRWAQKIWPRDYARDGLQQAVRAAPVRTVPGREWSLSQATQDWELVHGIKER